MNNSKSLFYFYLAGRWLLVIMVLSSLILIPMSIKWYKVYSIGDSFMKKTVLIDSLSVVSDEAGPMVTAYSKDLGGKKIEVGNSEYFLSIEDSIHLVWDNPKSDVAYLVLENENRFPKRKYFNRLLLLYGLLVVGIVWGMVSFRNYKKNE